MRSKQLVLVFSSLLVLLVSSWTMSSTVLADTQSGSGDSAVVLPVNNNQSTGDITGNNVITIPLQSNKPVSQNSFSPFGSFPTIKFGDAGYIRLYASGGRFYIHIGVTDWNYFPIYRFQGKLTAHFTNGKKKTWYLNFSHFAKTDWSSYRTYSTYGKHGRVSLTGHAYSLARADVINNSMGF
ncbi:hypothetical protein [Lactobacillus kefiranofaciens]|uniref:hypothetical protein n=1 Tax=Lactobacillus kefiranofaciens TaxID=267818 RepID=UPI0006D27AA4|nr:hypothetical protein [Lactobacillus kefiranofaciens]KRL26459.1 hypothetical protein FC94_GL000783 [Lactobacillus kefiranofaciens subsp. kefirgranum DSM 10550 = JCM 8572]MCJ2172888.1 hypothetical protein [Lactobacillus kefiranofaciens]MCP9331517.1 hypothetical protein [Lactobacillus kefiranofaciens]PAK97605.1 hypothetical protein B8W86_09100 [Lactobacillus kefiranofaciens]QNT44793.1 hypothetical protein ICI50_03720 [Lactobacillus kefiranofaciens]